MRTITLSTILALLGWYLYAGMKLATLALTITR